MPTPRTLFLVDVSGFIHRAFHAVRPLATSRGFPTNALYGLATMLKKFARERQPQYCALAFDAGRETFRNTMFADYKANRPPAPRELALQFPIASKLAAAMGFPVIEVPGFEADDLIATLAARARADGFEVVIESGDKDLLQLVGPGILAHDPLKDLVMDRDGVIARLGVPPEGVRDYLALVGDASDNVPGVAGIGAKGAAELIARFGSLEGVYAHLDDMSPRKRDQLLAGRDAAFLSRDLIALRTDVPIAQSVMDLRPTDPDRTMLRELFTELEFGAMLRELGTASEPALFDAGPVTPTSTVTLLSSIGDLKGASRLAVLASMVGRDPVCPKPACLAVAAGPDRALVLRPGDGFEEALHQLTDVLPQGPWVASGYKELSQLIACRGLQVAHPILDIGLASYLLHPERESHSLDSLALQEFGETLPPVTDFANEACAVRVCAAWRLADRLADGVAAAGLTGFNRDVEIPLARILGDMERTGVRVDREMLRTLSTELGRDLQALEGRILREAGCPFNPNSPKQLAEVLFDKLGLPVIKKTKTGPSTDVSVLEALSEQHPVPALILEYRGLAKLKSTYADALGDLIHPVDQRVHTSYNQMVTATGRLSSSDPNLQNIPVRTAAGRKIRAAFLATEGWEFVSADYSQIELRVLAHLSQDAALIEAFATGADIHAQTAARIFHCDEAQVTPDMRRTAKIINFGLLYGMGAFRLARDLRIGRTEADAFIAEYFAAFPGVRRYLDETILRARDEGSVATLSGRRRAIEGIAASNHNLRTAAERMATNTPIQGTAADLIKEAMVRLDQRLREGRVQARLVLQVHDELVLEAREGQGDAVAAILRDCMEGAGNLAVPLRVDVGRGRVWSELHA